jgi:hypothetical protein
MLQDRLGLSERRACRVAGQHRSTQRHEPNVAPDDAALRKRLREISKLKKRWGYRRAHARLIEEGWSVNRKRVQRLWREEGLRVPRRKRKRARLGDNRDGKELRAERRPRGTRTSDAAIERGEDEREQPTQGEPVDDRGGEQTNAALDPTRDQLRALRLAGCLGLRVPEGDRPVNRRLAGELGEPGRRQPAAGTGDQPADSRFLTIALSPSVAGEAEQMAAVVEELVDVAARHDREGTLVHANEIDEQQKRACEERPWPQLAERDRRRVHLRAVPKGWSRPT